MEDLILKWIQSLTESRPELLNFPICPYAKQAYISQKYQIKKTNFDLIEQCINESDLAKYQVIILYLEEYQQFEVGELSEKTAILNAKYNKKDIVILDNEPRRIFKLNGVLTPFQGCYLWVLQHLSDLNEKSKQLAKTDYYKNWTQEQLDEVVTWRFNR